MDFYTFNDLGYGVELIRPDGTSFTFLQGDDHCEFLAEEERVSAIWGQRFTNQYGKFWRKQCGPFTSYEQHLSAIIDQYDY